MTTHTATLWPAADTHDAIEATLTRERHGWRAARTSPPPSMEELHVVATGDWIASEPAIWHGTLTGDDATTNPITLLGAQRQGPLKVSAAQVLHGHHLVDDDLVTHMRWLIPGAGDAPAGQTATGVGILSHWSTTAGHGLALELDPATSLPAADLLATQITRLWEVATGNDTMPTALEVRLNGADEWHLLQEGSSTAEPQGTHLFAASRISHAQAVAWTERCTDLGAVPAMVRHLEDVPVEVEVLVLAAGLEGLHRLTYGAAAAAAKEARKVANQPSPTLIPDVTRPMLKAAVKAASTAAADAARESLTQQMDASGQPAVSPGSVELLTNRFESSLSHCEEPSFRERLDELLAPIAALAPGLFGPDFAEWSRQMVDVRNNEAHQLGDFLEVEMARHDLYVGLGITARWALRLALLQPILDTTELTAALRGPHSTLRRDLQMLDQMTFYPLPDSNPSPETGYSCVRVFDDGA